MSEDTVDKFLARGGQIKKLSTPEQKHDGRSDYSWKDKIDVAKGKSKQFNRFVDGFLVKGNRNWKFTK